MEVSNEVLRKHVIESNLIELINADLGDPLYDSHLLAAQAVARGEIVHPNSLHLMLSSGVPELSLYSGKYRDDDVCYGNNPTPRYYNVPNLMDGWFKLVDEFLKSEENFEESAYFLHTWFLCIHPYIDGNGRTARLILNMLRIQKGLPWHIEYAATKENYYARIRAVEHNVFKEKFPNVY